MAPMAPKQLSRLGSVFHLDNLSRLSPLPTIEQTPNRFLLSCSRLDLETNPFEQSFTLLPAPTPSTTTHGFSTFASPILPPLNMGRGAAPGPIVPSHLAQQHPLLQSSSAAAESHHGHKSRRDESDDDGRSEMPGTQKTPSGNNDARNRHARARKHRTPARARPAAARGRNSRVAAEVAVRVRVKDSYLSGQGALAWVAGRRGGI
ncbi:hypothetical protein BDK51DRAFT_51724 [Blyttiomyces helicus]|uniref:Uncharacterized protein n=1 Tax=Blyttiomyces helicus TaxID=388810 RepID=A0A4P9WKK7_9FUNG|nr:hypothetical protein BDK51DRAFT_51724 [Blyttiomyces helicus]|eukprot:RKO91700.1 hypothetical protein BDK51DRAFT_51724 [Blyttiomyces helicus]